MKIIYYYHIPKCGGTTINNHLKKLSEETGGRYYDFNTPMKEFGIKSKLWNDIRMTMCLREIRRETHPFKFVHHHHGYYGLGEITRRIDELKRSVREQGHEFYLFTCIREPISFLKSTVNYGREKGHDPYQTFDSVNSDLRNQNRMYMYLLYNHAFRWGHRRPNEDNFERTYNLLDQVFLLEDMPSLMSWLEAITGISIATKNLTANKGRHELSPTEEQIKDLTRTNALDFHFYNLAVSRDKFQPRNASI